VIHYQEQLPLPLPHNIEPRCDTTVEISGRAYTGVDRQFGERSETMQVKIIPPHLHPKL